MSSTQAAEASPVLADIIAAKMPSVPQYDMLSFGGGILDIANPGERVTGEKVWDLRDDVARLLDRKKNGFPGAQPISFTRQHLEEDLLTKDYFVCEKSDGLRYLMYLTCDADGNEMVYLIDRKNDYWHIPTRHLHFPRMGDPRAFHTRTLIDGELVIDRPAREDDRPQPKFLAFDCLVADGQSLMHRGFNRRLGTLNELIIKPFKRMLAEEPERLRRMPFTVELKHLEFSYGVEAVFKLIESGLLHKNDGLIFTNSASTYKFGTDPEILKWKPAHENSIDCRLRLRPREVVAEDGTAYPDYNAIPHAELWTFTGKMHGKFQYRKFTDLTFVENEWQELVAAGDPLHNRIVECYQDQQGRWRISRFRDDKPEANHYSVLDKVLRSIEDGVEQQHLIDAADKIRTAWKTRQAKEENERKMLEGGHETKEEEKSEHDKEEGSEEDDKEQKPEDGEEDYKEKRLVQGRKRPVDEMSESEVKKELKEESEGGRGKRMRSHE